MSKELRFVMLLIGSLLGILVLVGALAALLAPRIAATYARRLLDPAGTHRIAMKIATFTVPRGYVEAEGSDMFLTQTVAIQPLDRKRHFFILLQGTTLGTAADAKETRTAYQFGTALLGMRCTTPTTETFKVRGRSVDFERFGCQGGPRGPITMEIGTTSANAPLVTITATGAPSDWDAAAFRALLSSIR